MVFYVYVALPVVKGQHNATQLSLGNWAIVPASLGANDAIDITL